MDRYPGSKLSMQPGGSNNKRFNRVQQIGDKKGKEHQSAAGIRKAGNSSLYGKNVRTKSSVGGPSSITDQAGSTTPQNIHPMMKNKTHGGGKISMSWSNLEDSIGGIIGNKIQSRHNDSRSKGQPSTNQKPAVSPNVARKRALPKN